MLIALVARVDAAPDAAPIDDEIALAVRYANLLTGVEDPGGGNGEADEADETDGADEADTADAADAADTAGEADTADTTASEASATDARQPDGYVPDDGDGQLALLEAEQTPAGTTTDSDEAVASSPAGAIETFESWMRHPGLSLWGRLDLRLAWRRHRSEPLHTRPQRTDEVWLIATWRR